MTGPTHLALGTAAGSLVLVAAGVRLPLGSLLASGGLLTGTMVAPAATGGLLVVCMVASLFPDLDAPESELVHAPRRMGRGLAQGARSVLGLRARAPGGVLLIWLAALVGGAGEGLVRGLSLSIRSFTHHRGFTHELRGALVFTGLVAGASAASAGLLAVPLPAVGQVAGAAGAAWLLGYLTHLLADAATPAGIPLLGRAWHLLPPGWRVRTGSWLDTVLVRGLAWASVLAAAVWAVWP